MIQTRWLMDISHRFRIGWVILMNEEYDSPAEMLLFCVCVAFAIWLGLVGWGLVL